MVGDPWVSLNQPRFSGWKDGGADWGQQLPQAAETSIESCTFLYVGAVWGCQFIIARRPQERSRTVKDLIGWIYFQCQRVEIKQLLDCMRRGGPWAYWDWSIHGIIYPQRRWIWDSVPSTNHDQRIWPPRGSTFSHWAQYSGLGCWTCLPQIPQIQRPWWYCLGSLLQWDVEGTRVPCEHVPTACWGVYPGSSLPPCHSVSHQHKEHHAKSIMEFDQPMFCQKNPLPVSITHFPPTNWR